MTYSSDFKVDDNDYIFVDIDDEKESCNGSFDYCDDDSSKLSQSPSSFESICSETMFTQCSSEVTLDQLNGMVSMISLVEDMIEKNVDEISSVGSPDEDTCPIELSKEAIEINHNETKLSQALKAKHSSRKSPPQSLMTGKNRAERLKCINRSRMSNKKRRKKLKLLKKITATTAVLSERKNTMEQVSEAATSFLPQMKVISQVGRINMRSRNATMVYAAESRAAYRKKHIFTPKKVTHSLNYVQLL